MRTGAKRNPQPFKMPTDIDAECRALVAAMNRVRGIRTTSSCCGHGRPDEEFCIVFQTTRLAALPDLLYWFDGCHSGTYRWRVEVDTDCARGPAHFCVVGPSDQLGFIEADHIADCINHDVDGDWPEEPTGLLLAQRVVAAGLAP